MTKMHPYRIIGLVFGALALVFGGFMLVGLLLPGGWSAERTVDIDAPVEAVFGFLDGASKWSEWTPNLETGSEYFGPERGAGSGRRWNDPSYGQGEFVISSAAPPDEVRYEVAVEGGAIQILGWIRLQAVETGTRVSWSEEGDFGWNPVLGYMAGRMGELQGVQLEASLASLKAIVEAEVGSRP